MIFKAAEHESLLKHQSPTFKPLIQALTYTYLDINLLQLPFELINLKSHPLEVRKTQTQKTFMATKNGQVHISIFPSFLFTKLLTST